MTLSASEKLAADVEAKIAAGEDPLGDNDPLEEVDDETTQVEGAAPGEEVPDVDDVDAAAQAAREAAEASAAATEAAAVAAKAQADETGKKTEQLDEAALRAVADEDDLDDEPSLMAVPDVDFKAKQDEIEKREADIDKKWTDGTITDEERNTQMRQVRAEQTKLTREQTRVETIEHINEQRAVEYQRKVLNKILTDSKAAGQLDYSDQKLAIAFDRMLGAVAGDPENEGKSYREIAQLAHEAMCATRGVKGKAAGAAAAPAAPAAAPAAAAPRVPPKAPITLRDLPAASTPHTGGSALDAMGNLKGQAYQDAFNRLTPAQQAQLLDA